MKDEKKHNKLVAKKARAAAQNKANKLVDGEETKGEDGTIQTGHGIT